MKALELVYEETTKDEIGRVAAMRDERDATWPIRGRYNTRMRLRFRYASLKRTCWTARSRKGLEASPSELNVAEPASIRVGWA